MPENQDESHDAGEQSPKPDQQPERPDQDQETPVTPPSADPTPALKTPVVAVGASAGGLEALEAFFRNVPKDSGIAFVVVTHINPQRKSLLPELLGRVTEIPIVAAEDGMRVEPDRIIVAKDGLLTIAQGKLRHIRTDDHPEESYHPIDHFMRCLADDQKERAVAVILSGTGKDGAIGAQAIQARGGMIMIQSPQTAAYNSMPAAVEATGLVDYSLPAEELPEALVEYCSGSFLRGADARQRPSLPQDAIRSILVRLRAQTGQDFTCYKKSTMSRRIERRMNVHRIDRPQDYLHYMRENPAEMSALLRELLISVTSFFRDPEAFDALTQQALPQVLSEHSDDDRLRVWVAGCATGEEAYSIAICIHEQLRRMERHLDVQIFASDLDHDAIEIARDGLYPQGVAADISRERLHRYFSREDGAYRIHKTIRDMIVFAEQNVLSDPPFIHMDLVICRNLLIYLEPEAQEQLFTSLHYSLREGGILFLGTSETVGKAGELFEAIDKEHKIYRRRPARGKLHPRISQMPPPAETVAAEAPVARKPPAAGPPVGHVIQRLLLQQFAPCSVVVDEDDTVVYMHGRSGLYFEPEQGRPRNNIHEMARRGLREALYRAISQARGEASEVRRRGVRVRTNGESMTVDLTVKALHKPRSLRGLVLVTVEPCPEPADVDGQGEDDPTPESQGAVRDREEQLDRELTRTREDLQSTVEELQSSNEEVRSSNEELQSMNEELQSANEELETSKEEMESLNEELRTVNAELETKVDALTRANDDMANLLHNMQVTTVFLDTDLRVARFTEQAREIFRLIDSDIGRPLTDLTSSLDYPSLVDDCREVLHDLARKEVEVRDDQGRWHLVRIFPYRTAENVISGLVLTVVSIERRKRAEADRDDLRRSRDFFEGVVQTLREPLLALKNDQRVIMGNAAFHRKFRTHPEEINGKELGRLGDGQWDVPALQDLLENVLAQDTVIRDYRVAHEFPWIGHRVFLVNARKLPDAAEQGVMLLMTFEDITQEDDE